MGTKLGGVTMADAPDSQIEQLELSEFEVDEANLANGNGHAAEFAEAGLASRIWKTGKHAGSLVLKLAACTVVTGAVANFIPLKPAVTRLGPQESEITLTLDSTETVDMGPLDQMTRSSEIPVPLLGFNIAPKGVIGDDSETTTSGEFTEEDIEQYAQFHEDIDIWEVAKDLMRH